MFRFLFTRLILPLLIFWLLRHLFKSIGETLKSKPQEARKQAPPSRQGGELKRDPVCGTYVSADTAITRTVKGEVVHFCSAECRDKFRG